MSDEPLIGSIWLNEWKEKERWKTVATRLAQRLRSIPESGATRFPDARDRAALKEYDNLIETYGASEMKQELHKIADRIIENAIAKMDEEIKRKHP
jgi:predicted ArsR family transcriptional regulator